MMNREQTVEKLKQKLDQWNTDLDKLESKVESFKDERREEARTTIRNLRQQRDGAKAALERLTTASDEAFGDLSAGVQKSWDAIAQSIDKARERYN